MEHFTWTPSLKAITYTLKITYTLTHVKSQSQVTFTQFVCIYFTPVNRWDLK